jgi:hypothetical protein
MSFKQEKGGRGTKSSIEPFRLAKKNYHHHLFSLSLSRFALDAHQRLLPK